MLVFAVSSPAQAQQYWKKSALLADMFPTSDLIAPETLNTRNSAKAFRAELGYSPLDSYTFYVATTKGVVDGYVLFDDQIGQHEPITFAIQLSEQAEVVRVEVVTYRESQGAEIVHPRFRGQFVGLGAETAAAHKLRIVSGATYSSKSLQTGVERAIFLTARLVEQSDAQTDQGS